MAQVDFSAQQLLLPGDALGQTLLQGGLVLRDSASDTHLVVALGVPGPAQALEGAVRGVDVQLGESLAGAVLRAHAQIGVHEGMGVNVVIRDPPDRVILEVVGV